MSANHNTQFLVAKTKTISERTMHSCSTYKIQCIEYLYFTRDRAAWISQVRVVAVGRQCAETIAVRWNIANRV